MKGGAALGTVYIGVFNAIDELGINLRKLNITLI